MPMGHPFDRLAFLDLSEISNDLPDEAEDVIVAETAAIANTLAYLPNNRMKLLANAFRDPDLELFAILTKPVQKFNCPLDGP